MASTRPDAKRKQPVIATAAPESPAVDKTKAKTKGGGAAKPPKPKLVRDSYTIPRDEHRAIEGLKARGEGLGRRPKKSELLRAGLLLLTRMSDEQLARLLEDVPSVKTGRPKGHTAPRNSKKTGKKPGLKATVGA